jgi:Holliday junction DNA helicase RuvB
VRSAGLLDVPIDAEGAAVLASRARGTPRIANRLLRRVRDVVEVRGHAGIDAAVAEEALALLEVDGLGLDDLDRKILRLLCDTFEGRPVGLGTIADAVGESADTIEDVYEPFLLQEGLISRTPRGRVATPRAFRHLGLDGPRRAQQGLF